MRGSLIRYSLSDYATVQGKRRDDRWGQTERASGNKLKMYTHTHTHIFFLMHKAPHLRSHSVQALLGVKPVEFFSGIGE